MLNSNLTITVDANKDVSRDMPASHINKTRQIVQEILEAHKYTGIWRLQITKRQPINTVKFVAKAVVEVSPQKRGIRLWTMVVDRDGSWESILWPPSEYRPEEILSKLNPKTERANKQNIFDGPNPFIQKDEDKELIPAKAIPKMQPGMVICGTVVKVSNHSSSTEAQHIIELLPGIVGACSAQEWGKHFSTAKIGDEVKVMIKKITFDGIKEVFQLSKIAAESVEPTDIVSVLNSFVETPDDTGHLSLLKFSKDEKRLTQLLEAIAECYPTLNGRDCYCRYVPYDNIWSSWEELFKRKYGAKTIGRMAPLLRPLIKKQWVEQYIENDTKLGYYITIKGWEAIGGPQIVDIDPNLILVHLAPEIAPVGWDAPIATIAPTVVEPVAVTATVTPAAEPEQASCIASQVNKILEYKSKKQKATELTHRLSDNFGVFKESIETNEKIKQLINDLNELVIVREWIDDNSAIRTSVNELFNLVSGLSADLSC